MISKILISIFLILSFVGCSSAPIIEKKQIHNFSVSLDKKNSCMKRMKYYKVLTAQASNKNYFKKINKTTIKELCTTHYRQTKLFMDKHLGKIGIIIEKNKEYEDKSDAIIAGIKESLKDIAHDKSGSFIVKMVPLKKQKVNTRKEQIK